MTNTPITNRLDPRVDEEITRRQVLGLPLMTEWTRSRVSFLSAEALDMNIRGFILDQLNESMMPRVSSEPSTPAEIVDLLAEALGAPYSFPMLTPPVSKLLRALGIRPEEFNTDQIREVLYQALQITPTENRE